MNLFKIEDKDYKANEECEKKLMAIYGSIINKRNTNNTTNTITTSYQPAESEHFTVSFGSMSDMITYDMVNGYRGKVNIIKRI